MNKLAIVFLLMFPFLVYSQVAITFSDDFSLEENSYYDNWEFQDQLFFVLPLSINDFIAIESYQFNILYDPQVVELDNEIIAAVNNPNMTSSYQVADAISGQQGNLSAEVFDVSANQQLATISYSHSTPISEEQFDNGYAILVYLPFKKIDPCSKAPLSVSFSDGNIDDQYANPNQINSIIFNESLSADNGSIITQDAFVNFNYLSAEVTQNGMVLESSVLGGTPPYTFEWKDKMDEVLATDSFFMPAQSGDYLFYVYDQYNCVYTLYVSFDQTASVEEFYRLSVYPNPAEDYIEVSTSVFESYQLINLRGQQVSKGEFNSEAALIPRNDLPSGIYFLKLIKGSKSTLKKVAFK